MSLVGLGGSLALLGLPLVLGVVPPNPVYGFRTPRTLQDKALWYPVNRVTGIDLVLAGIVMAIAGYALDVYGSPVPVEDVWILVVATIVPVLAAVLHSFVYANKRVVELDTRAPPSQRESGEDAIPTDVEPRGRDAEPGAAVLLPPSADDRKPQQE